MSCNCKEKKELTPVEQQKAELDKTIMGHARALGSLTNQISKIMQRVEQLERNKK